MDYFGQHQSENRCQWNLLGGEKHLDMEPWDVPTPVQVIKYDDVKAQAGVALRSC